MPPEMARPKARIGTQPFHLQGGIGRILEKLQQRRSSGGHVTPAPAPGHMIFPGRTAPPDAPLHAGPLNHKLNRQVQEKITSLFGKAT
jgi:hypothetical protein